MLPVLYGMLFSLCLVSLVKGSISAIAVGTGAVVLGIALSYSIHLIAHQRHVRSVEQLIRELVFPLTVGSLTTIGAFLGLLFTSSALLRDFGLFASMTLVGTTIFSLVFLPHFLSALADTPDTPLLRRIERIERVFIREKQVGGARNSRCGSYELFYFIGSRVQCRYDEHKLYAGAS